MLQQLLRPLPTALLSRQLTRRLRPHMRARARVRAVRTTISASRTLLR